VSTIALPDAAELAAQALAAIRVNVDHAVEEMLSLPRHVLVYPEGQDDLAHLALEGVTSAIVQTIQFSNPALDNIVVLDSLDRDWADVSPVLEVSDGSDLMPGYLHPSQTIVAFGEDILRHDIVLPVATRAVRFYAAIPDGPGAEELIERVHPLEEAVLL